MQLLEFISQELYGIIYRPQDPTNNVVFLKIVNLLIIFNTVKWIVKDRRNGMIDDEIVELFINSFNIHNGFKSNKLPRNPPIYTVPVFGIMQ